MMSESAEEQAVFVFAPATPEVLSAIHELEDQLAERIVAGGVGEYDGHEIREDFVVLFMYGADADKLFGSVAPIIASRSGLGRFDVVKRYGEPGAREVRVTM